jgi:hypothetical protein
VLPVSLCMCLMSNLETLKQGMPCGEFRDSASHTVSGSFRESVLTPLQSLYHITKDLGKSKYSSTHS